MIFIYAVFPSLKEAKETAKRLVNGRLAACVNIFPIDSVYLWKGRLEQAKEQAVIIKTKKQNFKKIEALILKHHSCDTPCIAEILLGKSNKKYSAWLEKSTKL